MKKIQHTMTINSSLQKTSKSKLKYDPPILVTLGMSSDTANTKTVFLPGEGLTSGAGARPYQTKGLS